MNLLVSLPYVGNSIQKLLVFERKIVRRIFGPTKENQIWGIQTNEELDKLIKHKNIVSYICGLVVRVSGYRYRGPGFDPRRYQIF